VRCHLQSSFREDPTLLTDLFVLLDRAFGLDLSGQERAARALGGLWDEISTPFVHREDGRLVGHVGVLAIPMRLEGRSTRVGGIHAVATDPAHRGRGHARRLLGEALAWCDGRFETLVLGTAIPDFYAPAGFRVIPTHRFVWRGVPPDASVRRALRRLDCADPGDRRLLHRLLDARVPLSDRLGILPERTVFLFNQARSPLYYSAELDLVVALEREADTLRLFDVVCAKLPPLSSLLEACGGAERVELYFTPDRFGGPFEAEPHVLGGDDFMMARGPFPPEGRELMWPPSARC
jgi:predicted N-acetyltransferase YhbS